MIKIIKGPMFEQNQKEGFKFLAKTILKNIKEEKKK
jgi:hypothetical protein